MWHTGRKSLFIHAEEVGNVSDEFFTWYLISIGNDIPIGGIDDIPVIKRSRHGNDT